MRVNLMLFFLFKKINSDDDAIRKYPEVWSSLIWAVSLYRVCILGVAHLKGGYVTMLWKCPDSPESEGHSKSALPMSDFKGATQSHFIHFSIPECFSFCCCLYLRRSIVDKTAPSTGITTTTYQYSNFKPFKTTNMLGTA